ncbi:putative toxin-antitoxin system toxin component, PIN family [Pseudomonas aeruginosa]|uniref:putative toxin-antitoxin system toxin component, PIN family n=1 Tax=Pseudomonas aeruginosa TaxID=287 RepID=UPI0012320F31|nr:putative toxin-antitoxin system toxin component, PIN family [Pseudomonas aeruginosa]KAA5621593.1 putative toxin-antitoxin system toxin component, PIN family [Pseudomonas aeruginosa]KAA5636501.1 putative toxin-antitoxin system toxin component, PIN family [Pseudomonas aeruginosa]MBO8337220.1 putative toxin-antitoxin system toxin component, PIN family [Pseudomonas aeruginosa]HCF4079424.1 putative toxin-antitoxin system toxin component, PIN family [Pseudomonas aeruginosa]
MRVVLDSNILFSALISPHGAPDVIYRAWRSARFEVVTSRMQLDEIRRASRYPKLQAILQPAKVGTMINNLQRAVVLERLSIEAEADDPDDAFLLAMAVEGETDYLVTGDRRAGLLQRVHIGRTRIVTPAQFCAEVL